jgi:hypothetical protein
MGRTRVCTCVTHDRVIVGEHHHSNPRPHEWSWREPTKGRIPGLNPYTPPSLARSPLSTFFIHTIQPPTTQPSIEKRKGTATQPVLYIISTLQHLSVRDSTTGENGIFSGVKRHYFLYLHTHSLPPRTSSLPLLHSIYSFFFLNSPIITRLFQYPS